MKKRVYLLLACVHLSSVSVSFASTEYEDYIDFDDFGLVKAEDTIYITRAYDPSMYNSAAIDPYFEDSSCLALIIDENNMDWRITLHYYPTDNRSLLTFPEQVQKCFVFLNDHSGLFYQSMTIDPPRYASIVRMYQQYVYDRNPSQTVCRDFYFFLLNNGLVVFYADGLDEAGGTALFDFSSKIANNLLTSQSNPLALVGAE